MDKISITSDSNEIRIIECKGLDEKPPRSFKFIGNRGAVAEFLAKRMPPVIFDKESVVKVNVEEGKIEFINDLYSEYEKDQVVSKCVNHPDVELALIKGVKAIQLANHIKFNRTLFGGKEASMSLVAKLSSFEANVTKAMKDQSDDKGNYDLRRTQIVETNLPQNIIIHVIPFKGEQRMPFEAELIVNPADLTISLVSYDLEEYMTNYITTEVNKEVEQIRELRPDLPILFY